MIPRSDALWRKNVLVKIIVICIASAIGYAVLWGAMRYLGYRSAQAAVLPVLAGLAAGLATIHYLNGSNLLNFLLSFSLLGSLSLVVILWRGRGT
jgi:hypothetical protein